MHIGPFDVILCGAFGFVGNALRNGGEQLEIDARMDLGLERPGGRAVTRELARARTGRKTGCIQYEGKFRTPCSGFLGELPRPVCRSYGICPIRRRQSRNCYKSRT